MNNATKAAWKAKQPVKERKPRGPNKTSFKKNLTPHNKLSAEQKAISITKAIEYRKKWRKENREKLNAARREKRRNNPQFRIACNLRKRLSWLVREHSAVKTSQTLSLLGCSMEYFMRYLSAQFREGMSFDNYGKWHIDHKIPCNLFDLTRPEQQASCFHYTNLQPLWALDNIRKSDKIREGDSVQEKVRKNIRTDNGLNILGFVIL